MKSNWRFSLRIAFLCLLNLYLAHHFAIAESGSGSDVDETGSGETEKRESVQEAQYEKKCNQLEQFTPGLCKMPGGIPIKCHKVCSRGQEGMDCGWRLPPDPTKKLKKKPKLKKKKKGKKASKGDKRIVGGKESLQGEWPWQVYLVGKYTPGKILTCGGAILSKNFILTASHCVKGFPIDMTDASRWKVWVGNHNSQIENESFEAAHTVKKIIPHPSFYANPHTSQQFNDVAIFQLDEEIKIEDQNKGRICLPNTDKPIPDNGYECYVTGWGKIKEGGEASAILKHARVLTMKNSECNSKDYYYNMIDDNMMCAGHDQGGTDACQGDSGGSLACLMDNYWYSTGIVSWGWGCARPKRVGVYTNTTKFKEWIVNTILDLTDDL